MNKIIVAIDGFSSCGKSTMAKDLAKEIGYIYIDTGAMYRAVTLYCICEGLFSDNGLNIEALRQRMDKIRISFLLNPNTGRPDTYLNDHCVENEIRNMQVSSKVSIVSTVDFVRSAMVAQQQEMGKQKGIVMDGRDIGTVVFPQAELKIFVTARADVRAQRRYDELKAKGNNPVYEEILQNVEERDHIDQTRAISPLRRATDALLLDNSDMTIAQQKEWLFKAFEDAVESSK